MIGASFALVAAAPAFQVEDPKAHDSKPLKDVNAKAEDAHRRADDRIEKRKKDSDAWMKAYESLVETKTYPFDPKQIGNINTFLKKIKESGVLSWWDRWASLQRRATKYYHDLAAGRPRSEKLASELAKDQRVLLDEARDLEAKLSTLDGLLLPHVGAYYSSMPSGPKNWKFHGYGYIEFLAREPDATQPGRTLGETALVKEAKRWKAEDAKLDEEYKELMRRDRDELMEIFKRQHPSKAKSGAKKR